MIKRLLLSLTAILTLVVVTPLPALAQFEDQACQGVNLGSGGECTDQGALAVIRDVTNVLVFIVGAIAVIMIIIGGFRYVISSGNDQATAGAKNTIMFAVVGLVVAFLAFAIVNFVIAQIS